MPPIVRKTITQIVDESIKPLARAAGFKKKGYNFHRRKNDIIQVVNVQFSHGNFGTSGGFYINLGIAFDKLTLLEGRVINETLREHECHFNKRIAKFCPNAPDMWEINESTELSEVISKLTTCFKIVVDEFNKIDSIETFLERDWLYRGSDLGLLARLHYVLGNYESSWQAVQREAEWFVDRQGMSVEKLIERYYLDKLKEFQNDLFNRGA